jgi:helix-turn-helix protein
VTPEQAGAATRKAVGALGAAFLEDPRTLRRARELGLTGWACYVAGRGGALGDVRSDTVAAALGLIAPEAVRDAWAAAKAVLAPSRVAEQMLAECCRWGAERLGDAPRVARLAALAEQVVVGADASAFPLFAAWRAMPVPDDGPGARAAAALHLLYEHRASALLLGIRASGLTPVQALIAGPEGEASAVAFGWQPPYPKRVPLLRRRAWADAVADHLAGQALRALAGRERAELVTLLRETNAHVRTNYRR